MKKIFTVLVFGGLISFLNAQLFISEVADPKDFYKGRFVEIYNDTDSTIDLGAFTYYLSRQSNGGGTWGNIALTGTIGANSTYVVAFDSTEFNTFYSSYPNQDDGNINGNGDDAYYLFIGGDRTTGTLVDIYGVKDEDGSGKDWEYLDGRAERNPGVIIPNTTWTASEWTITRPANTTDMTPGFHDPTITINPEPTTYPANFTATQLSSSSMKLTWVGSQAPLDKQGYQAPDKYLIQGRTEGGFFHVVADSISWPDDSNWMDGNFAINVSHNDGADSLIISGMLPDSNYYFVINPYTNFGENINYKTVPDAPQDNEVLPAATDATVTQIQDTTGTGSADSPLTGEVVKTKGLVFAAPGNPSWPVNSDQFWMMDGTGAWTGIVVETDKYTVAIGDSIEITGTVIMDYGITTIGDVVLLTIMSSANELPMPDSVATGTVTTDGSGARMYQSAFIKVTGVVDDDNLGSGEWSLDDGSGSLRVDDGFYAFAPVLGSEYTVTGPLYFSFNNTKILPRSEFDISRTAGLTIVWDSLAHSPFVPEDQEDVDFSVNVTDFVQEDVSAYLIYYVNDVPDTVMMGWDSVSTGYSYTLSADASNNGDVVGYSITAYNAQGDTALATTWQGYFVGDANIETAREVDEDGTTPFDGFAARFSGIMTAPAQHLGNQDTYTALQVSVDQGIVVISFDSTLVAGEGDSLQITGEIGFYNGLLQLEVLEYTVLKTDTEVPAANELTLSDFVGDFAASEYYEGSLILIKNVEITSGGTWGSGDQNFTVTDDAGTTSMTMRIFNVMGFWDIYPNQPTGTFDVVAVLGQYDYSSPYTSGYQLLPVDFPTLTDIADDETGLPRKFEMSQNYPNPFNPTTSVKFALPQAEEVTFSIFNVLGQRVFEQVQKYNAGINVIEFSAESLSSGVYFYRIQAGQYNSIKKMVLMK